MKKAFRKMSVVLAAVMAVAATSMMPVSANSSNTSWATNTSCCRKKDSNSSVYVKNETSHNARVYVNGRSAEVGQDYSVSYYNGRTLNTTNLTIPANSHRTIKQFVNELGYTYVNLVFHETTGVAHGLWAPDTNSTTNGYDPIN